jgi:hypothetical protein
MSPGYVHLARPAWYTSKRTPSVADALAPSALIPGRQFRALLLATSTPLQITAKLISVLTIVDSNRGLALRLAEGLLVGGPRDLPLRQRGPEFANLTAQGETAT